MLFSEELEKYSWDEITQQIYAKTDADVERALNKKHLQIDDFMALISPAADKYLEKMASLKPHVHPTTFRENDTDVCTFIHY